MSVLKLGNHFLEKEPPDLWRITIHGDVSPQEATEFLEVDSALCKERGYALLLVDAADVGRVPPETRRAAVEMAKKHPDYRGSSAVFGVSFYGRTLLGLTVNAVRLLAGERSFVRFFSEEAEARTWLASRRAIYLAKTDKSGPQK